MEDWDERTEVVALVIVTKKKAAEAGWELDDDVKAMCEQYGVNQAKAEELAVLIEEEVVNPYLQLVKQSLSRRGKRVPPDRKRI